MRLLFLLFISTGIAISAYSQKKNEAFQLPIQKATGVIKIDGIVDEADWLQSATASDFYMVLPMDTSKAKVRTEVKMTYDDDNLYLVAICYHALPGPYIVESLRRDFSFGKNDNFLIFMDTFDDQTNGFSFGANAAGAQWDGLMFEGGKVDLNWDNKWTSVVKNYDDKWIFEAAIPFKTIRYKNGITKWGINFSRLDLKTTEKSSWTPVPRQFPTAALAFSGSLVWDAPPKKAGVNVSVIPYVLGGVSKDYEKNTSTDHRGEVGLDVKVAVTSSLNLDLTVNPDFSQVDVDRQVTNLDRFELFFPERRQFFLENGDMFNNFGYTTIRPFFSRRIGLSAPIQAGARLSGKLDKNWRIAMMDMQTGKVAADALPAQNFAVLALQRKIFARSNIGMLIVNKESLNYDLPADPTVPVYSEFNRNLGFEYNLASSNNLWTGKALYLKSFSPVKAANDYTYAANVQYSKRRLSLSGQYEYVGNGYTAEVGYVPRKNFVRVNPQVGYLFFPSGKTILSHGPKISTSIFFKPDYKQTDSESFFAYGFNFRKLSTLTVWVANNYVKLLSPFDPTNSGKDSLATGSEHRWNAWGTEFASRPQRTLTYAFSTRYGGYYQRGTRLFFTGDIGYRVQPYVSILLSASYNDIRLPDPWGKSTFWLVGPRIDVTFTNKIFFTTFLQYNEQRNNMNLNTRFQWRYRPASDLFIVYTDNYLPENVSVKNHSLVLKFTYWWNL
ncbi:MAG: carbohydrate binding family 9 domain-containing protein [Cyclobacteriaceae bacterium]|nr:carbohydrate binding family 9 domain-containing protein [Cyclobacteriaceae bacterium]